MRPVFLKTLFFMLNVILTLQTALFAAETPELISNNAFALKLSYHTFIENNLPYGGQIEHKSDFETMGWEMSYERKMKDRYWLEFSAGRYYKKNAYRNVLEAGDLSSPSIDNYHFSITPAYKARIRQGTILYIGLGPDYYYTKTNYTYEMRRDVYKQKKNYNSIGFHGLAGIEYIFFEHPYQYDFFVSPVGLFLEYKCTRIMIKNVEQIKIENIAGDDGPISGHDDKSMSSHMFYFGLKWHF